MLCCLSTGSYAALRWLLINSLIKFHSLVTRSEDIWSVTMHSWDILRTFLCTYNTKIEVHFNPPVVISVAIDSGTSVILLLKTTPTSQVEIHINKDFWLLYTVCCNWDNHRREKWTSIFTLWWDTFSQSYLVLKWYSSAVGALPATSEGSTMVQPTVQSELNNRLCVHNIYLGEGKARICNKICSCSPSHGSSYIIVSLHSNVYLVE